MVAGEQSPFANQMLSAIRRFDARGPGTPQQVEILRMEITRLCALGTDCTPAVLFCDVDRVAEAAVSAYSVRLDELQP